MQKKQLKRPYFAPEITTVEFKVEMGATISGEIQYNGDGLKGFEDEFGLMMFISSQNNPGARMGGQMGYFGDDCFTSPSVPSGAFGGGYGGGGYFGGGF